MKNADNRSPELTGVPSSTAASTDLLTVYRKNTGEDFHTPYQASIADVTDTLGLTATAAEINRAADVSARIVALAAAATNLTVTETAHDGKIITLASTTGQAITLPAATGSGSVFTFVNNATIASSSTTIKVANTSDAMTGYAYHLADGGDTVVGFETTAGTDTITWNGTTTGGLKGARVTVRDIATNQFHVEVFGAATGTEAIPFSATV